MASSTTRVIGLMSGTSFDAIDAAAADLVLDGDTLRLTPRGMVSMPYPERLRTDLADALPPNQTDLASVCRLDTAIGQAFAEVAVQAVRELCDGHADLVVSHGQTVHHWVDHDQVRGTLQLGQPAWIVEETGIAVISDLRPADVAAGGQGAPLVSLFDALWLAGRLDAGHRPAALNLGGIANVSVLDPGDANPAERVRAWDTGAANALIDAAVRELTGGREQYDHDGQRAARGRVHPEALRRLLAEPYHALPPPKTTGKELFHPGYLTDRLTGLELPADDLVATLTELTARTVTESVKHEAPGTDELWVSGGGVRNPAMMRALAGALPDAPVRSVAELGLDPQAKEAYAFAVLGFLTVHGLPGAAPSATGARRAAVLGRVSPGDRPWQPPAITTAPRRLILTN